jgi:hypothetical protein
MNWRDTFLTGILAAGLLQAPLPSLFGSAAWADTDHDHHHDRDDDHNHDHDRDHEHDRSWHEHSDKNHDHDRWWHEHDQSNNDHAHWWQEHHESDHDGHTRGDNTRDCGAIHERIRYDSQQVREIDPAKHPKARQWYKDDIRNAQNDLRNCRP